MDFDSDRIRGGTRNRGRACQPFNGLPPWRKVNEFT